MIIMLATSMLRLNPSFCGIWSLTLKFLITMAKTVESLNPSFCGIWSLTLEKIPTFVTVEEVLILLFVEYGL